MYSQNNELASAMAWRVKMISYFQILIEATLRSNKLSDISCHCLRIFAAEEIERLNVADHEGIVTLYLEAMAAQTSIGTYLETLEELAVD